MIVAVISTSSALASVAVFQDGSLVSEASELAPMRASGTIFKLLGQCLTEITKNDVDVWIADVGPGSFTGVKVGVTIVKTIAYALKKEVASIASFDLIGDGDVAVPSRKGKHLLRAGDDVIEIDSDDARVLSAKRYDYSGGDYPQAKAAARLLREVVPMRPELLLPNYVLEPNISVPKAVKLQ